MEWLNRMRDAIDYIENNIETELDPEEIAKVACCSTFHFQRMFLMLTGVTLKDYIRKRRLTLAAQEIAVSDTKVIDLALKYGYDSPESFSKAFRRTHGCTPSAARKPGVKLKAFPRISFQLYLKGDKDMDYRIVERKEFKIIGKALTVTTKDGENLRRIPKFWDECNEDGTCENLLSISNGGNLLGVCIDFDHEKEEITYMVAVEDKGYSKDGFTTRVIPEATWAVFTAVGPMPNAIQEVWKKIFQEWFPATGYEHAKGPELEVYFDGDPGSDDYRSEVWIPIIKK